MEARTLASFSLYHKFPAITCTEATTQSAENEPTYARTPLKACLAVVFDSSPELLQDSARDFSLYVLDPLEAQPLPTGLAQASHETSSPPGVAVALGLMSWALESNDSTNVFVTGTIIPHASLTLEVVFALRETKRMPKPVFHSYPSLGSISAPGPSQLQNLPPQAAGISWLSTTQERQTLTRSADFPELYIGPPRRARGRPEGSTSSKSKVMPQARASSPSGASSSRVVETQSESKQEVGRRSKQGAKSKAPRAPPTYSPFICAPLTRHTTTGGPEGGATGKPPFDQQSYPFGQNQTQSCAQVQPHAQPYFHPTPNPLLGILSAIPSTSSGHTATNTTPEQQAVLLSALEGLFATNPHLLQLVATNTGLSASSGEQTTEKKPLHGRSNTGDEHNDGDSDIVILDSSTVDTTAFCKPSTWELTASDHDMSPLTTNQESPVPSRQGVDSSPLSVSTLPSRQEKAPVSSHVSTPSVALESTLTVTPEAETPTSKERTERGNVTTSHALDMPGTFTPSRTRKRKLGEYIQGQAHSSIPMSPPSPSPSMTRTSSSGRTLTARQRVQSSPTGGTKSVSLPSVRLPSMLGSMRAIATSGPCLRIGSSSSSTHGHPAPLTTNKSGNQSITLVSGPSKSKTEYPGTISLNGIASDTTSVKRRRTLNEFMAEHEARKNAKVRKRSSSGRKLEADTSANASQAAPSQSAKSVSTRHAQSSPPRPLFRSDLVASSLPASTCQPPLVPGAAVSNIVLSSTTTLACAPPDPSTSTAAPAKSLLKNFVLPAWARTSTAMLPRLSEEALVRQRAEREAKKVEVSLRRREAAKAKRKRLHGGERPSKESSDEDDEAVATDTKLRTLHPSSTVARSAGLPPPPLPSLPVFASDAVEPIPSSPPQSHCQLAPRVIPSTPPRKPTSSGSAQQRTPNKSGSCSLFTPSGQDPGSLFTPTTPSVTRSLTRVAFTPRSPTALRHSGARKSPRKSVPQTPKHNSGNHQTPRSLCAGRNPQFASPSLAIRTSQTFMGMGTRAFLLPPPSPCALRTPHLQKQVYSKVPGGLTPIIPEGSGIIKQGSPSDKQNVQPDKGCKEEDMLRCKLDDALLGEDMPIPPVRCSPSHPNADDGRGTSELRDITFNGDASKAEEEYTSSPLPPSSPLPASAFSSPAKHHDSNFHTPTVNNLVVPDSDILLPSASDSDGPQGATDATWLSDGACTASWLTDSEASAWLTETEAWLTDTEGGPLLADSDATWLSDSDAVFGDMSSLPPSSASNWLSDDADADTDGEFRAMEGQGNSGSDAVALERAFATLVERGGRGADKDEIGGSGATHGAGVMVVESEFWESMQPLLGGDASKEAGTVPGGNASEAIDEDKVAQDIQELLDRFNGT
ncbi:hypothetical protein J3R82DRAFT_1531 [Butyriboletus roseoflavus]|nr:hypothetical protein J3R82DRAFT_1531 [Butyriboletus roseoflavus]